jgi:hypothetical protein
MSWRVAAGLLLLAVASGCWGPPKPQTPEERAATSNAAALAALRDDREAFEAAAHGDESEAVMTRLRKQGVLAVMKEGRCIAFHWPFTHVLDSIPIVLYAPGGRDDLPHGFLDSPGFYLHPVAVDENWFVARTP